MWTIHADKALRNRCIINQPIKTLVMNILFEYKEEYHPFLECRILKGFEEIGYNHPSKKQAGQKTTFLFQSMDEILQFY